MACNEVSVGCTEVSVGCTVMSARPNSNAPWPVLLDATAKAGDKKPVVVWLLAICCLALFAVNIAYTISATGDSSGNFDLGEIVVWDEGS